jgi:3-dehydroquinate dehydratase
VAHQVSLDGVDAILINAGAGTDCSYGLRAALAIFTGPIVEVHMSNVFTLASPRLSARRGRQHRARVLASLGLAPLAPLVPTYTKLVQLIEF